MTTATRFAYGTLEFTLESLQEMMQYYIGLRMPGKVSDIERMLAATRHEIVVRDAQAKFPIGRRVTNGTKSGTVQRQWYFGFTVAIDGELDAVSVAWADASQWEVIA